jgi:hypothetical protein
MVCPARDPEDSLGHQNVIDEMVQEDYTDNDIVAALTRSEKSLQRRS